MKQETIKDYRRGYALGFRASRDVEQAHGRTLASTNREHLSDRQNVHGAFDKGYRDGYGDALDRKPQRFTFEAECAEAETLSR